MPNQLLIDKFVDYEGYSRVEAQRLVDIFIKVMRDTLVSGRNIELEGIGTLAVVCRKQTRRINGNLKNVIPTIEICPKQVKTVKLRSRVDLSYKEK
jgi:nucleoid DNA-binding protein